MDNIEQEIEELFDELYASSIDKRHITYRIMYKGVYITTRSGKTQWTSIGAAKNALRNHFNLYRYRFIKTHEGEVAYQEFLKDNVQFVKGGE